jgi:tol-pal system protein YbgF
VFYPTRSRMPRVSPSIVSSRLKPSGRNSDHLYLQIFQLHEIWGFCKEPRVLSTTLNSIQVRIAIRAALCVGALASLVGCAHNTTVENQDEAQRTLSALRAQNAAYLKKISELENEVFILQDRVETREVAAQRVGAPALPSVTLTPAVQEDERSAGPSNALYNTEVVTDPDGPVTIEYTGDATSKGDARPVLRLVGDRGGISVETPEPDSPVAPAARSVAQRAPRTEVTVAPVEKRGTDSTSHGKNPALELYRASLDGLTAGTHADAASSFREFLRRYPTHDYADNAQYWLGECYYDLKDYATAVREFRRVVEKHANGNKVPDALLKIGFSYLSLGENGAGRRSLQELVRTFPQHPTARLAGERLAALSAESTPAPSSETASVAPSKEVP